MAVKGARSSLYLATLLAVLLWQSLGEAQRIFIPLEVHRPQLLTRVTIKTELGPFGAPFIQGRDCTGALKSMSIGRSCASEHHYNELGVAVDRRGVMSWEDVPPEVDYRGRVALIPRGGCSFHVKALEAERAGAIGVLVVNNEDGEQLSPMAHELGKAPPHIPIAMVSQVSGGILLAQMAALPDGVVVSLCHNADAKRFV